ncbi:SprT-like domain-containing protein [Trueperella pecoris]|uniref:SprT-like domain-containing protein n=1 Tax=Trueperella pecoris TaxID=2733571 RepID=UPI00186B7E9A|nr:SprT-like domain-containing protein [Trueperella pecoris]QOQ39666.1 sprT domain-containing protein [Trueperella pecoris]
MDLAAARRLARTLMDGHGLTTWHLSIDRAKRRAGYANHSRKTISLSRPLIELYSPEQVRLLVLHEVAHAIVGPTHGHDEIWREACVRIGGDGRTSVNPRWPNVDALWVGVCPNGHRLNRHRLVRRASTCRRCSPTYDERYLMTWTNQRTGEVFR